jgi:hypothetical protein
VRVVSDGTNYFAQPFGASSGSVSNYYTSTTGTAIGPTSITPASTDTLFIRDATASTGKTVVTVKGGPGNSYADTTFQILDSGGTAGLTFSEGQHKLTLPDSPGTFDIGAGVSLSSDDAHFRDRYTLGWSSNVNYFGTIDTRIRRSSAGVLDIDNGTDNTGGGLRIPALKSTTGTRYICIDTNGALSSSASACSGT